MGTLEIDRPSYPGLNSSSVDLWRKFLKYYQGDFASFDYNVRVGQGILPPAYLTDAEKLQWKMLTQKRIDVLAERFRETWVIEIIERPGLASVGQLVGYGHLTLEYLRPQPTLRLAFICARLGHDMSLIFRKQGILVFYFPSGKPPSFPPTFMPTQVTPATSSIVA